MDTALIKIMISGWGGEKNHVKYQKCPWAHMLALHLSSSLSFLSLLSRSRLARWRRRCLERARPSRHRWPREDLILHTWRRTSPTPPSESSTTPTFFLFLVGLELAPALLRRTALAIATAGILLPMSHPRCQESGADAVSPLHHPAPRRTSRASPSDLEAGGPLDLGQAPP